MSCELAVVVRVGTAGGPRRGYDADVRPHLASLVEEFRRHSAETAIVAHRGNRRYATSYGDLAGLAGRFAAELERRGVKPGDRVVLWGENSAEWIGVFFGCLLRGVIAVPLDAAGEPGFAAKVIADVSPKLVVGDPDLLAKLGTVEGGEKRVPGAEARIDLAAVMPALKSRPISETLPLPSIAEHLPREPLYIVSDAVTQQTPFQIVFTSGTTSEPRGIVHTHRNVLVTLEPIEQEMAKYLRYERLFHPLRFLHSLPLSHVFGQFMGLWIPALLAAEVHFAPQLEPARITDLIRRERISVLIAVPRVLHLLRAHLLARFPELDAELDASAGMKIGKRWWHFRRVHRTLGWKFWAVISGGATLPADLEAFWNRLGFALIQGYGMTETAALVTLNHPFHIAPGTIGKPLPGREVKITDEGEILVRGDMLAGATWQRGAMHQREGEWLSTGDLAERNASGDLKFLGRKGDVIVTAAGMNIHPADLEAALAAQPGVRGCAVVACDLAAGPEPVAVVIANADVNLDAAVRSANRTLAEYQQIRRVLRWPDPQFPYTSTGKLIRRQVAQWACDTLAGRSSTTAGPSQDALLALIAEVTGEPVPDVADRDGLRLSEDLHLDSLGRVQLQSALEQRFGLELEDDELATVETVGELRAIVDGEDVVRSTLSVDRFVAPSDEHAAGTSHQQATVNVERTTDHVYPRWPWSWPIVALRIVFLELVVRPLVWLLAKPRVICAANLDSRSLNLEPCLLISNHVTAYDGALVLYGLPFRLRRKVAAAMSGEMLLDFRRGRKQGNWLLNLLAPAAYFLITALFNVFPLPRARGFRRSFAHAGEAMDRGYSVLIFPEGTRSRTGAMNSFRPGIGLLAQESAVPIVPVALVGLYDVKARWFHAGRVEVRVGEPIAAPGADTDPAVLTAALERGVRTLMDGKH
jgi:long-chain acyl-CoA synthetase